ncbi:MAG: hypothetical protein U0800_16810 [Isosphaeraceae bacterium]
MRYLIAILLPPLGLLLAGKPFQALFSLILMITLIGWPVAAAWAILVMLNADEDRRTDRLVRAMKRAAT